MSLPTFNTISQSNKLALKKCGIVLSGLFVLLFLCFVLSLIFSFTVIRNLKQGEISKIATPAKQARFWLAPVRLVCLHKIADFEILNIALLTSERAANKIDGYRNFFEQSIQASPNLETTKEFKTDLSFYHQQLQKLAKLVPESIVSKKILPTNIPFARLDQGLTILEQDIMSGQHRFLILLQNSDELRATGGFMGSYVDFSIDEGSVTQFKIQDIYQPDGQFQGFVAAPTGVAEYLSSGNGLRLPDANWHPDFPSSSLQILRFFALGDQQAIEGIAAMNVSVVEDILRIVGPIDLPDYQTTLTADNFATLARTDRANFFPGSQQKPNFLNHVMTRLKYQISTAAISQKKQIVQAIQQRLATKDIQLFSTNPTIESFINELGLSGSLKPTTPDFLMLVESNVGINKANREVSREVKLSLDDYRTTVEINLHNHNQLNEMISEKVGASHLAYINYQRLIVPTTYLLHSVTINGQPITDWKQGLIQNNVGEQFSQFSFLVEVLEQNSATIQVTFNHQLRAEKEITIFKQSGIPAVPYQIQTNNQIEDILLEKDTLIQIDQHN